jgi:hypothetical protein
LRVKEWEAPHFMGEAQRDAEERQFAERLTRSLPRQWHAQLGKQLKGIAQVSPDEGDLLVTGRIVDCQKPVGYSFFIFSGITFDLKITDAASGELLLAFHNRKMAGRDLEEDELAWVKDFAGVFKDPVKLYGEGKPSSVREAQKKAEEEAEAKEKAEEEAREKAKAERKKKH